MKNTYVIHECTPDEIQNCIPYEIQNCIQDVIHDETQECNTRL